MEHHFHLGIEHIVLGAVGIAVTFHAGRMLGGFLASQDSSVLQTIGTSIGGFFTFNGATG
ncbi:MAG TPA: hypothetical protein VKU60_19890 [Chloroflexota bacterium]|nr:hypothetical protein [Chloroflexota bacterium]